MDHARLLLATAATLALAGAARATTWELTSSFSTASSTGVFSYGTGVNGRSFTPFTNFNSDCLGAGTACWQTLTPVSEVPAVIANTSGATINTGTVVLPLGVLLVHPGPSTDTIVQFTAPATAVYGYDSVFELLDTNPSGVIASVYIQGFYEGATTLTTPGATHPGTPGQSVSFSASDILLGQGETIDFGVNNDGSFYDDSTGLALTVTSGEVPEPAAWALMLVGLGGMGASLRATSRKTVAAA
jgi:hypothetical protein